MSLYSRYNGITKDPYFQPTNFSNDSDDQNQQSGNDEQNERLFGVEVVDDKQFERLCLVQGIRWIQGERAKGKGFKELGKLCVEEILKQEKESEKEKVAAEEEGEEEGQVEGQVEEGINSGMTTLDIINVVMLTLLSMFTRFYRIGDAKFVVWDEAHFGKFGGYYVKGQFYHDVHPPLAKMLVGLSEYLTGFDGAFMFDSGKEYPHSTNFWFMRVFNASFGMALVPLAYITMRLLGRDKKASFTGGVLILTENALCVISRFILLDGMLLCFTAMALCFLAGMYRFRKEAFADYKKKGEKAVGLFKRRRWEIMVAMTGVSLGLVSSAKWVGLFAVALVGIYTIDELYELLGTEKSLVRYAKHWGVRIIGLIGIPIAIYMAMFRIHFNLLYKTGPDDATMPSLFQARLEGSSLMKQPFEVAYGSVVTLKSRLEGGGLLHSHAHKYPTGSGGQQITCYGHKDNNNEFMIVYVDNNDNMGAYDDIKYVKEGMVVRLMHKNTNTTLQVSKQHKAPLTSQMFEVNGSGDVNVINRPSDQWQVEIVKTLGKMSKRSGNGMDDRVVTTLSTEFRLKNVDANCYLGLSGKPLPDWGYSQSEVGCIKPNSALFGNTIWNVEFQVNSRLPNADPASLKTRFVDDFVHLNKAMYRTNNALLPDNDKIDHLTSPPISWPFLIFGLRMCGWDADRFKYLMLGNPVTWWGSTFAVLVTFPLYILYLLLSYKRTGNLGPLARSAGYIVPASILWGGWLLHYLPFFIMGRVTYLHHYFPSLYFQNLFMALQLSHFFNLYYSKLESICKSKLKFNSNSKSISKSKSTATITATKISIFIKSNWWVILCVISTAVFLFFSPLTFGFNRDASELWTRQWLPSWKVHD